MRPKRFTAFRPIAAWLAYFSLIWGVWAGEIGKSNWTWSQNVLSLEGEILPQSSRQFHRLLATAMLSIPYPEPIRIELDSPGGDLDAVLRIVRIIRSAQREKTTVAIAIRSGKRCFSTCLLLFATADYRVAAPDALFSFPNSAGNQVRLKILSGIADVDPELANHLLRTGNANEAVMASQLGRKYFDFITLLE